MRIAIFYPKNIYAGWYAQGGYVNALKAMGHEVLDCFVPGNQPNDVDNVRKRLPTLEELDKVDLIISSYHEYMTPWYYGLYDLERWKQLAPHVLGRFDESFDRPDLLLHRRWEEMSPWAKRFSFPAQQDAKRYEGQWLPFGADTTMFNYDPLNPVKKVYDLGFIGSLYPVRMDYLQRLAAALPNTMTFNCGNCVVQDLGGVRGQESTELLADNYRKIKIFFCLPPLSQLIVAKIPDVMACGTFVMYPRLPYHARLNMNQFVDKKHLVYYNPGYVGQNAEQILYYLENELERELIASNGYVEVLKHHTLERMLQKLIDYGVNGVEMVSKVVSIQGEAVRQ